MPELPDYVISASVIVCERVLREEDKVQSAIRIADVWFVPKPLEGVPKELHPAIQIQALAVVRVYPGTDGTGHLLRMRLIKPSGESADLGDPYEPDFTQNIPAAPGGITIQAQIGIKAMSPKAHGTYYICLLLDEQEIARAPVTLVPVPDEAQQNSLPSPETSPETPQSQP